MKYVLLASALFCSLSAMTMNNQNQIKNFTQWNLDGFINDCLDDLNMDSCMIVLVPSNTLIRDKYEGMMVRNGVNIFTIMIYHYIDYNEACLVISHELVHAKQMFYGQLKTNETKTISFNGKTYKANTNDEILNPHEVEAHKIGGQLFSKNKRVVYSPPPITTKRY